MKTPRTRKAMIEFLSGHFRYDTMNSWNRATSYAANVKLHRLPFPNNEARNRAYDLIQTDDALDDVRWIMREFDEAHDYDWQVGFNGRSGGYIVLYQGGKKPSEHRSWCKECGQANFKAVLPPATTTDEKLLHYLADHNLWVPEVYPQQPEVKALGMADEDVIAKIREFRSNGYLIAIYDGHGKKMYAGLQSVTASAGCGRCHAPDGRINWSRFTTFTYPGKGVDGDADFEGWDTCSLKQRVKLVMEFDRMVQQCITAFVNFCANHEAVEESYTVQKTRLVASPC